MKTALFALLPLAAAACADPPTSLRQAMTQSTPTLLVTNGTCSPGPCKTFAVRGWESVFVVPGQPPAGFLHIGDVSSPSACLQFPDSVLFIGTEVDATGHPLHTDSMYWTPQNSVGLSALEPGARNSLARGAPPVAYTPATMPDKKAIIEAAGSYLRQHPQEVLRAGRNAVTLRVGLPLDALRWLASQATGKKAPKDVQIEAVPPGIRVAASVDAMGTPVRASATIFIDRVRLSDEELFYLESRGLSPGEAREMLVLGYFEDLLDKAPEVYREGTLERIRSRLAFAA